MNMKTLLIALLGTLSFGTINAQDKLYKKNGDMIEVKVTEINTRVVSYKKADNPEGPTYTINKADVSKVVYPNGSEDFFGPAENNKRPEDKKPKKYGNNILSFMPMQITSNVGIGLAYERVIDKAGILSFYMPVTMAFNNNNTGMATGTSTAPTYYIMPGLKFYPTGGKGVVRYAVGPNLAYVTGEQDDLIYDNNGNIIGQGRQTRSALGILITNSLNINPTSHLHLGLELGLGFTYFNKLGNQNLDADGLAQFGFKIGYRF